MINACKYASADDYLQTTSYHTTSKRQQVANSAYLGTCTCTCTRLDSTKFDQDKTRPNTIQIIPFGFYFAGQNPDLMMMENNAGTTTTTTTTMEREKGVFLLSSSEPKINLRGRKKKQKDITSWIFKNMPTSPKCIPSVVQSLTPPASQPLSLSLFLCQMYLREDRNLFAPFYHHYQHRSINQAQWEKERGGGRKEEERGGRSVTHSPTSLIWHISTT